MKRKLSLLLVLAMILTLVPMSAFAATDNSVNKVPKVADDYKFKKVADAPQLRIEEDNNDEFGASTNKQTFRLKLENAEWIGDFDSNSSDVFTLNNGTTTTKDFEAAMQDLQANTFVTKRTDTTVEVTVYGDDTANNKIAYKIPMLVEMKGKGDAKVTVDPRDSVISGATYTIAVGAGGDTTASIDDVEDFTDNVTIKDIEIEETNVGALGNMTGSKIKLKLPSDFKWSADMKSELKDSDKTNASVEFSGGFPATPSVTKVDIPDDRTMEIYVTAQESVGSRGSIFLKGLKFTAKSDAEYGDVTLDISGDDISSADLVVAKYCDYDVVIKADGDAKELVSGRMNTAWSDDDHKLQTLIIKEEVENAWLTERKTKVEFPAWVKILGVELTNDSDKIVSVKDIEGTMKPGSKVALTDKGDNYVEFTVVKGDGSNGASKGKAEVYLKFFVSVKAGKSGDIVAKVSGRAVPKEGEVVLGKAIAPVSVEANGGEVRTGIKGQEIGDIVIKEAKKEAIKKGSLQVELGDGVEWATTPKVTVTEGTIDLDEEGIDTDGSVLTIPVDSDSSKPATIKITGVKVDLDRTIPEGDVKVEIKGLPVVENNYSKSGTEKELKDGYFDEATAAEGVVATVITPADANTKAKAEVKFVIGNAEFQVGEEVKTADVAPYIKDGRTMLSLRYVAEAMGVANENIMWDGASRTVTIFKGDRVAKVAIGSKELMVNGTPVMMDTAAEIKDGRTCLPLSYVAKALGAEVEWEGATKTVTLK
ncbi:MAG: copper amine oxidase N-terminal domain-containing protein [Marinisporobacter sp.]|jgi:hypothetical protein|nr:copper amine oxidase N-terminal domain-containing protein [Marinisporobacter sp.]